LTAWGGRKLSLNHPGDEEAITTLHHWTASCWKPVAFSPSSGASGSVPAVTSVLSQTTYGDWRRSFLL